ncbi:sensor histidine kinase [Pelotomaculum propionicicum]|uniref:sensor histidine kinase n=1 Tax=Pelotomaculum propionicicum TaxID=258475 RepID=UPI003B7A7904
MDKATLYDDKIRTETGINRFQHASVLSDDVLGGRRVLKLFRYISWFLTSLFYLRSSSNYPFIFQVVVVLALLLASWVAVRLYSNSRKNPANIFGIIVIDTLFVGLLLLIPTGGINSPFMWYALNPVFMAISMLPVIYCWGVLGILSAAVAGSAVYYGNGINILNQFKDNLWFSLVFLLLITAALLFARLNKQVSEAYQKLSDTHQSTERLLDHISDLYQALESFSVGENPRQSASLLATYAKKLTGSRAGFCYIAQEYYDYLWETSDPDGILAYYKRRELDNLWSLAKEGQARVYRLPLEHSVLEGREIVFVPLQSDSIFFGLLGYVMYTGHKNFENESRALRYLAELVAAVMERQKAEDLSARLMVVEEQNRIANEIHDGVSQQLFSVVYALHALSQKKGLLQEREVQKQLSLIKRTANQAAKDLRASIYRISPNKRGEQVFLAGVSSYLEDLAKLNNIDVEFLPEGSEESLSPALRKALYRIIREATSNAIRHGRCDSIKVILKMTTVRVSLQIIDDGKGFVADEQQSGLGLVNMRSLMATFNGSFTIDSYPGSGTIITCVAPDDADSEEVKWAAGGA